jgi:type IV pilus assembly protein PilC
MPTYNYTIKDASGQIKEGTLDGENESAIARRLQEQGAIVQKIELSKNAASRTGVSNIGGVKLADLTMFCRQFSTMIDAGVTLVRCLNVLGQQATNPKMKYIVGEIETDVQAGQMLSQSMARFPNVFNNLFVGLVKAGEVGGALEESMQRLSSFLEADMELRRKVKGAMTYPVIVLSVAVLIVLGLVTFILPSFMNMFLELGMKPEDMPSMTRALMSFSTFLITKWYMMIAIVVVVVISLKMFLSTKIGGRLYDHLKLKAPVFGTLNHKISLARFSRTLATLLSSGVPILTAMETVAGTVSNSIISDAVLHARARIREGDRIGEPLAKSKLFPPMIVQMIGIGEESGSLDSMLTKVAEFYESEVDAALQSLTSAIEPVMIVMLGSVVGFIVIAMFQPLLKIITNLAGGGE